MPAQKRYKTKYPGVYYINGQAAGTRKPELGERTGGRHNVAGVTSSSFVSMAGAEYEKIKLGCELWWTPGERDIATDIHIKLPVDLPFGYW